VIRFVFSVEDLARTRFAISPLWEVMRSLVALRDPSTAALHVPWLRSLSGRLGGIALEPVVVLMPPRGYVPDWERAIEPRWPRIRAFLDADVAHRARRLAEGGPAALFADLHPGVSWADDHLDVASDRDATIELGGQGVVLMPSAFQWARPATLDLAPWQPTLIYPARGIATLWDDGAHVPDALARLLGATRAAMLTRLDAPRSTTELAQRLDISPATGSHHLTALRDAGLATGRREGRAVLYVRTATGDALAGR
jgi:DNA-binding transcriptional ArsR family regulator